MAKFLRNYLINWINLDTKEDIYIGDTNWQAKEGWTYPNLLTINLDINRNTFAASNECHLQIYNLSKSHRQQMYHDRYRPDQQIYLEIMAGYGQDLSLIFRGKVLQSYSYMQGNDMVTDIQALDMGFMSYIKDGRHVNYTSMTLEAGTSKNEAIKRIVEDMEEGNQLGALGKIGDVTYQTPVSFLGNSFFVLDTVTGGHVFVDLGKINVLSDKEVISVGKIPLITAKSGLLGTPMRREGQLEVDILFEPSYIVGQAVELESITGVEEYQGVFKVIGIHHSGTISGATCGTLKTRLNLWYGNRLPQTDNANVLEEEPFSEVKNEEVTPVQNNIPHSCIEVYEYIQKNGTTPNWLIPNTTIKWTSVIPNGNKPKLEIITNLQQLCEAVQRVAGKGVKIQVSSGYRNASRNASVGGSSTSLHMRGQAIDVTSIGSIKDLKQIYFMFDSLASTFDELLLEGGCVHIGFGKGRVTHGRWIPSRNQVVPVARDR